MLSFLKPSLRLAFLGPRRYSLERQYVSEKGLKKKSKSCAGILVAPFTFLPEDHNLKMLCMWQYAAETNEAT